MDAVQKMVDLLRIIAVVLDELCQRVHRSRRVAQIMYKVVPRGLTLAGILFGAFAKLIHGLIILVHQLPYCPQPLGLVKQRGQQPNANDTQNAQYDHKHKQSSIKK